jgi:hypothetical protein
LQGLRLSSPKDRVLDLLVFAPAGIALTVVEQLPELAEKGRNRIEGQAATARVVGQFVVQLGCREVTKRARQLFDGDSAKTQSPPAKLAAQSRAVTRPAQAGGTDDGATARSVARKEASGSRSSVVPVPTESGSSDSGSPEAGLPESGLPESGPASNGSAEGPDLAIPAYDTLSASQVVKRLNGLSHDELVEVAHHERSNRHRATILNRVEQLLSEPVRGNP